MAKFETIVKGIEEMRGKTEKRKFRQSIDLVLNLKEIDVTKPENRLNDELILPGGTGKESKIALIATGELALLGKKFMNKVLTKEELEVLSKDKKAAKKVAKEYDFFVAQTDLMSLVGKTMGTVLGPRGKMPKAVPPNADLNVVVERLKKTIKIKLKDAPVIKVSIGVEDMDDKTIAGNVEAVLGFLEGKLANGLGNIRSAYIKATMGPRVKLEVA